MTGNRLTANNENIAQSWGNRDWRYEYDGLDRLIKADRGIASGFTYAPDLGGAYVPSQKWILDTLGNWKSLIVDMDFDGTDGTSPDTTEARTHNLANELTAQDPNNDTVFGLPSTYDHAGNMRTQEVGPETGSTMITYTHDLWNRLVKVEYTPYEDDPVTRAEYVYNALNWRIMKRSDVDLISEMNPLDQQRAMFYSANWQLLYELIDDESAFPSGVMDDDEVDADYDVDQRYIWGPRYIDDIVMRQRGSEYNEERGRYIYDSTYYHCTDAQFSTVAVLNDAAILQERVSYDPYGRARHHEPEDCSAGDGAVTNDDLITVILSWGSVPNKGDVNRDGNVDVDDQIAVILGWSAGLASGQLSITDNQIGWDGYVFNPEIDDDGLYTVRYRHYRPHLGRWLEEDPLRYRSSQNLLEYAFSNAVNASDPSGLIPDDPRAAFPRLITKCWDKELEDKYQEVLATCSKGQPIDLSIVCFIGPRGSGFTDPIEQMSPLQDRIFLRIACWDDNDRGTGTYRAFGCLSIKATILHELEHARQACMMGFNNPRVPKGEFWRRWDDDDNRICKEIGAYCSTPENKRNCNNGIPTAESADIMCTQACDSVTSDDDDPASAHPACMTRCLQIYASCRDGQKCSSPTSSPSS